VAFKIHVIPVPLNIGFMPEPLATSAMETVFLPPHECKVNEVNDSVEFENAENMHCTRMLFPSALGISDDNLRK
jgi:hypothetical protein